MLNISDLESRHKKYKLKSYIPYIVIFVSITVILVSTISILEYKEANSNIQTEVIKDIRKIKHKEVNIPVKKIEAIVLKQEEETITPIVTKHESNNNKKITLSPSLNFMNSIQSTTIAYYDGTSNKKVKKIKHVEHENKTIKTTNTKRVELKSEEKIVEEKQNLTIKKKTSIEIKRNQESDDIRHVIRRFKVNNNPALSLFVAKKYYKIGKYKKAYNYALITNQINSNIEASWIIFAKSLMKLKEQEMAIKTLKKYIDNSHSSRAKILLDEIQSGKFK